MRSRFQGFSPRGGCLLVGGAPPERPARHQLATGGFHEPGTYPAIHGSQDFNIARFQGFPRGLGAAVLPSAPRPCDGPHRRTYLAVLHGPAHSQTTHRRRDLRRTLPSLPARGVAVPFGGHAPTTTCVPPQNVSCDSLTAGTYPGTASGRICAHASKDFLLGAAVRLFTGGTT